MTEQKEIADVVLDTPEPDRWVDCGESRPLPMFHMTTLMQYGERCAEAALAWLRSHDEPVAWLFDGRKPGAHRQFASIAPSDGQIWPIDDGIKWEKNPLFLAPRPAISDEWQSAAARDVLAERRRQVEAEGWTPEHDDQHDDRSLALAAACYANQYVGRAWLIESLSDGEKRYQRDGTPDDWPDSWAEEWWKPKDPHRDLVRAAALILAEIERLDRASTAAPEPSK